MSSIVPYLSKQPASLMISVWSLFWMHSAVSHCPGFPFLCFHHIYKVLTMHSCVCGATSSLGHRLHMKRLFVMKMINSIKLLMVLMMSKLMAILRVFSFLSFTWVFKCIFNRHSFFCVWFVSVIHIITASEDIVEMWCSWRV